MATQVIGHQRAQTYLQDSIKNQSLTHAYLFCGPAGVGKTTLAIFFIEHLFKDENNFNIDNHPDILWIKQLTGKKDISIEQIREIKDFLKLQSWYNNYRIVIIPQADRLSKEASNALLKTLEEPARRSLLILMTVNIHKLLSTIVSRCQVINLTPVDAPEHKQWLEQQRVPKQDIETIVHLAQGSPGIAWQIITDQINFKNIIEAGNSFINFLKTKNINQCLNYINNQVLAPAKISSKDGDFIKDHRNSLILLRNWLEITRDLLLCKYQQSARLIFHLFKKDLISVSQQLSLDQIIQIIKLLEQAKAKILSNSNTKLTLEWLLISSKTII